MKLKNFKTRLCTTLNSASRTNNDTTAETNAHGSDSQRKSRLKEQSSLKVDSSKLVSFKQPREIRTASSKLLDEEKNGKLSRINEDAERKLMNTVERLEYYSEEASDIFEKWNAFLAKPSSFNGLFNLFKGINEFKLTPDQLTGLEKLLKDYETSTRKRKIMSEKPQMLDECLEVLEKDTRDERTWPRLASREVQGLSEALFLEIPLIFEKERENAILLLLAADLKVARRVLLDEYFEFGAVVMSPAQGKQGGKTGLFFLRMIQFDKKAEKFRNIINENVEKGEYLKTQNGGRYVFTMKDGSEKEILDV